MIIRAAVHVIPILFTVIVNAADTSMCDPERTGEQTRPTSWRPKGHCESSRCSFKMFPLTYHGQAFRYAHFQMPPYLLHKNSFVFFACGYTGVV
jgi:hypothetical protein